MATIEWDRLSPFSPPSHNDQIIMPGGTYTLMRGMYGWSLYKDGQRHTQIYDVDAMANLLALIYRVGSSEAFALSEQQS